MPATPPRDDPLPPLIEGRLLAHRRVLAALLSELPDDRRRAMLDWLVERSVHRDGNEDPGAVPADGLALGFALADEFRHLARLLGPRTGDEVADDGDAAG